MCKFKMLYCVVVVVILLLFVLFWVVKFQFEVINVICDQGFNYFQVMQILQYFIDKIGLWLINLLQMCEVNCWMVEQFKVWGLVNVYLEFWVFGCGWIYDKVSIDLLLLCKILLMVILLVWMLGMQGMVEVEVVYFDVVIEVELQKYKGKFVGKVVMFNEFIDSEELY